MKKFLARPRLSRLSSFTLVELLVVMGIIAILAAVLLSAGGVALKAAQRAKAANTANSIQTAVLGYYTEYSVYPAPPGGTDTLITDVAGSGTTWQPLICILCGNVHPSAPGTAFTTAGATITNSRGIAFLSLKASDVDPANDAPKNPLPTGTEIYFNIAIDSDYDGLLGTTGTTASALPNFSTGTTTSLSMSGGTSTAGVAVWANCNGSTAYTNANFWVHTY